MAQPKKKGWSFSRLDLYEKCPHAHKVIYLDGIPRAETEPLIIGSRSHGLVADYLNRLIAKNLQTDWEWAEGATPQDGPADVREIWERFYQNFIMPQVEAPHVERKIAFTRTWKPTGFFDPDAYFRLVVDFAFRQGDLVVVNDWKTNRVVPETVEADLQLRIYGWGVREAIFPSAQEVLLRLHFLRYGKDREILLAPGDLSTVPQELEARIATIEADTKHAPRPGSFCSWCGVQSHCPSMASALIPVEIMAPATREQAEKAATLLLAVREMDKMITGRLKEYVQQNGPIAAGDFVFGPIPGVSYDLDAETVTQQLLDRGVDRSIVWAAMKLSKTSINSALSKGGYKGNRKQEREAIVEEILGAAESKPTEEIRFAKAQ